MRSSRLPKGCFPANSVYLHAAPMFHLANGAAMYALMLSGGTQCPHPRLHAGCVMQAIERYRVNEILSRADDDPDAGGSSRHRLTTISSSLRRIAFGASPMSEALLDRAMAALPHTKFVQAYGMTELSPVATILHHREQIGAARALGRHAPAGARRSGVQIRIVDADDEAGADRAPWARSAPAATS